MPPGLFVISYYLDIAPDHPTLKKYKFRRTLNYPKPAKEPGTEPCSPPLLHCHAQEDVN